MAFFIFYVFVFINIGKDSVRHRKESLYLHNSFHSIFFLLLFEPWESQSNKSSEEYVSLTLECFICGSALEVICAWKNMDMRCHMSPFLISFFLYCLLVLGRLASYVFFPQLFSSQLFVMSHQYMSTSADSAFMSLMAVNVLRCWDSAISHGRFSAPSSINTKQHLCSLASCCYEDKQKNKIMQKQIVFVKK